MTYSVCRSSEKHCENKWTITISMTRIVSRSIFEEIDKLFCFRAESNLRDGNGRKSSGAGALATEDPALAKVDSPRL
jgi:hypothetical protein